MRAIKKFILILPILAVLELAACLLASQGVYRIGFPLDDAWIHQTYARNLAFRGEFAFLPGVPSAGSTSPLWTMLLVIGQWIGGPGVYIWTYGLGFTCLVVVGVMGERLLRLMIPDLHGKFPIAAVLLVTEWHLVWAAASGMETALYSAAILFILVLAWVGHLPAAGLGFLVGVTVWIRPDGISLLGPVGMMLTFQSGPWKLRLRRLAELGIGVAIPLAGYLGFNNALSGSLWPTTFYAKQAEYASLWQTSLIVRYFKLASLPWVGIGILLLPGFIYQFWNIPKSRDWKSAALMLWWLGYTGIYAYRLPVEYQHGRYLIPAMPVYFLLGLSGSMKLYSILKVSAFWKRRIRFASVSAATLLGLAFLVSGVKAYATDVAIIESEMVNTARWLQANTTPEDLLAVHDIGAVGYFSGRRMIDLAGLASPEVAPFIRDESKLAKYLDSQGVDYLVTFPDWYSDLPNGKEIVFLTKGTFSPAQGGTNMTVYRWRMP